MNLALVVLALVVPFSASAAVYPAGGFTTAQASGVITELFLCWFAGYWVGMRIRMLRQTVDVA